MTRQGTDSAAGAAMRSGDVPDPRISPIARRRMAAAVLNRFGTWTDAAGREHATADSREVLLALFCKNPTEKQRAERPEEARRTAADAAHAASLEQRRVADPARSPHATGDPGPWRAQVAAWGRENGWPDVHGRHALPPDLVDAYRDAHPEEA